LRRAAGEDGFQFIELLLDGVLACKAGGKLRLLDDGVKRRVEIGLAQMVYHSMRFLGSESESGVSECPRYG
jgi:hypothetical protein